MTFEQLKNWILSSHHAITNVIVTRIGPAHVSAHVEYEDSSQRLSVRDAVMKADESNRPVNLKIDYEWVYVMNMMGS